VLKGTTPVSSVIRERVHAAAHAVGYAPNPVRAVMPEKNGLIAFVISDITNPFFPEVVRAVEESAAAAGMGLLLCTTGENKAHGQATLKLLADRPVNGIIVCASRLENADLVALHERRSTPMVVINRRLDHPSVPNIIVDFQSATYRATRHLLDLKHTEIAYLAGAGNSDASRARRRGIELALAECGFSLRSEWCPLTSPNVEGGFQAMSALLAQGDGSRPTAVLAYNDMLALGALHAIRVHHLRVPADISVVGFDDIAMVVHANPPLTTIAQPKQRIGQLAMQMLSQMLRGEPVPGDGYTLVDSPLIVRESTAIANASPLRLVHP
jgi:DNA-binding LacI/PurR family transcriptional regulator